MGILVESGALVGPRRPIRGRFRYRLTEKYRGSDAPLSSVSFLGIRVKTSAPDGARRPIRGRIRHRLTEKYGRSAAPLSSVSLWGFSSKLAPSTEPEIPFEANFAID